MLAAALVAGGYALVVVAWILGNPPFRAPDEAAHYVRAVGLAAGQLVGEPATIEPRAGADSAERELAEWFAPTTRSFALPAGLSTAGWLCDLRVPTRSAACLDEAPVRERPTREPSYVGTYPPAPYVLPGILARAAGEPAAATRLGRAGAAAVSLALVAAGLLALASGAVSSFLLAAAVLALTPTAVFLLSSLNPNGLEVAAAFALVAALLHLTRPSHSVRAWPLACLASVALGLGRTSGVLWIGAALALVAVAGGTEAMRRTVRSAPRWSALLGVSVAGAVAANRLWAALYLPEPRATVAGDPAAVADALRSVPRTVREQVGGFNHLEFRLPAALHAGWLAAAGVVVLLALVGARRRERIAIAAAAACALLFPPTIFLLVGGFVAQGRYVLPLSLTVPLLAGEALSRNSARLGRLPLGGLTVALAAGAAALQAAAWYLNARRFAVGVDGPLWFPAGAEWAPPLGWAPWLLLVGVGALLLPAGVVVAVRRERTASGAT